MPCFFCNSMNHLSQFCDIHVSNGSRSCKTLEKKCCKFCLSYNKHNYHPFCGINCQLNKKCYICFTKDHHYTVYCPERNEISSTFLFHPKIDHVLISRYLKVLSIEEQQFLTILNPTSFRPNNLYPIQVGFKYKGINDEEYQKLQNRYIVATEVEILRESVLFGPNFKNMIFKAQKVSIKYSTLTSQEFLQLISSTTKEIFCYNINFSSTLIFREILQKVPNIVEIEFFKTNVTIANTWPQDLMENKRGNNFAFLRISVNDFDFDIKTLAKFMKTKSTACAYLNIYINHLTFDNSIYTQKIVELSKNLKKYFYEFKSHESDKPFLNIVAASVMKSYRCL